jgi:hypothetical protein
MPIARPRSSLLVSLTATAALGLAACGGGGSGATTGAATTAPGATTAPQTSSAPVATVAGGGGGTGGTTVTVTLTGGPDAGTYTGTLDPLCTHNVIGKGGWGVQYSTADLTGDKDLSSFQFVFYPDGPDPEGMFGDTELLSTVTIGPLVGTNRTYEISVKTNPDESDGEGGASVVPGANAFIEVHGTTADGVGIKAEVHGPPVTEM